MQKSEFELQGIQFPTTLREDGASVEILQLDSKKAIATRDLEDWISENSEGSENPWRVITYAKSKEESMFLILSEKRVLRTRYRVQSGRLTKSQEEVIEPEVGEVHLRKSGLIELYSVPPKQRKGALTSLAGFFGGKESLSTLYLEKQVMMDLIQEASEVSSVSLSGIGNPFFSDITLWGQDPVNSRTFKELLSSGTIKSFRAKFQSDSSDPGNQDDDTGILTTTTSNNCKVRFYRGRGAVAQSDIESYLSRIRKSASVAETSS